MGRGKNKPRAGSCDQVYLNHQISLPDSPMKELSNPRPNSREGFLGTALTPAACLYGDLGRAAHPRLGVGSLGHPEQHPI